MIASTVPKLSSRTGRPILTLPGCKAAPPSAPTPEPLPLSEPLPTSASDIALTQRQALYALFPLAFCRPRKPLAVGFYEELLAAIPDLDPKIAIPSLGYWCRGWDYLAALSIPGSRRIHLDGSDAGEVLDAHRIYARKRLEASRAGAKAQKKRNLGALSSQPDHAPTTPAPFERNER